MAKINKYLQKLNNHKFRRYALRRSEKNSENCKFLRERLRSLLNSDTYKTHSEFIDDVHNFYAAGIGAKKWTALKDVDMNLDQSRLSAFIGTKPTADNQFNPNVFRAVVLHLDFNDRLSVKHLGDEIAQDYEHPLFPAMLHFMDIGEYTLSNMKAQAPGLYKAYRPSSTFPGNYWVGGMEISLDAESDALVTEEFYQSSEFDDRPNRIVAFNGYMFRKGRHYTILSRNEASSSLCVALLPSVAVENEHIVSMAGGLLDMSTGRLYGSRVFYERVPTKTARESLHPDEYRDIKEQLFAKACVCSREQMPASIVHHFEFKRIDNITFY